MGVADLGAISRCQKPVMSFQTARKPLHFGRECTWIYLSVTSQALLSQLCFRVIFSPVNGGISGRKQQNSNTTMIVLDVSPLPFRFLTPFLRFHIADIFFGFFFHIFPISSVSSAEASVYSIFKAILQQWTPSDYSN